MSTSLTLVGLTGSLREQSVNAGVLRAVQELLPPDAQMEILPLGELPYYNMDLEADEPEAVCRFKEKVRQADAIFIATPEFNASVPGLLKNALDWASRPYGGSVMTGKLTAITGAGAFDGTASAQAHLRLILSRFGVPVVDAPEVHIAKSWEKFDANGDLTDDPTREQLRELVAALLSRVQQSVAASSVAAKHSPGESV